MGMDMTPRHSRDLRRMALALRMLSHRARTSTICQWTGLPKPRVQGAVREFCLSKGLAVQGRLPGPAPSALTVLWESRRLRREAAAIAGLCQLFNVAPVEEGPADLRQGERLCLAYETFLTFVPKPKISLEHAVLLVRALAQRNQVALRPCEQCGRVLLADLLAGCRTRHCTYC